MEAMEERVRGMMRAGKMTPEAASEVLGYTVTGVTPVKKKLRPNEMEKNADGAGDAGAAEVPLQEEPAGEDTDGEEEQGPETAPSTKACIYRDSILILAWSLLGETIKFVAGILHVNEWSASLISMRIVGNQPQEEVECSKGQVEAPLRTQTLRAFAGSRVAAQEVA